jgi:hypothetical protein
MHTSSHVQLLDVPLSTSDLPTPTTRRTWMEGGLKSWKHIFVSTTVGMLGFRTTGLNPGHATLVIRANMEQGRGHTRLGCDWHQWLAKGVLLRDVNKDYHVNISFDEDSGRAIILASYIDHSLLSLLSVL